MQAGCLFSTAFTTTSEGLEVGCRDWQLSIWMVLCEGPERKRVARVWLAWAWNDCQEKIGMDKERSRVLRTEMLP